MDAKSSSHAWSALGHLGFGLKYDYANWCFGYFAEGDWIYGYQDGFTESGAGDLGWHIEDHQNNWSRSKLGLRASHTFCVKGGTLTPSIQAAWLYIYPFGGDHISGNLVGYNETITVKTTRQPISQVAPNVSLTYVKEDRAEVSLAWEGEFNSLRNENRLNLTVARRF